MKLLLSLFFILGFVHLALAQTNEKVLSDSQSNLNPSKTVTFKIDSAKLALKNNMASNHTQKTVAYYDSYISALENKRDYISSDQTLKAKAEVEGWFTFVDAKLAEAKLSRSLLLNTPQNEK